MSVALTGRDLTLAEVLRVAREGERVELSQQAVERMRASREVLERVLADGADVYGATTGVGARKVLAAGAEPGRFNRSLIAGHLIAQGPAASEDVVRATMLRLANGLAQGSTGARPELAQHVVEALNSQALPHVRVLGSVGEADLSANADLAHHLLGDFELAAGEALALLNSNSFSTGLASLAVADSRTLLEAFEIAGALDLEAFAANLGLLDPEIGTARPHPGLRAALDRLRGLLEGSALWEAAPRNLQDPLSFRSLPQVAGAARDVLAYAERVLAVELNAHQGNPLVVTGEGRVVAVGNFDVLPLAAALDFLRIALAPVLTSGAERALKLLTSSHSGLPQGLSADPGVALPALDELGAAVQAIAAEGRLLAQPVSFELASTSQHEGIEDRTTMAPLAARRLAEMVELAARVAAIELTVAAQAVDLRRGAALGNGTARAYELVRERIPFTGPGETLPADLEPLVALVRSGRLASAASDG